MLAVTLVLSLISMSRIHGQVWFYLVLWAWGTDALLVLTIGWAATLVVGSRSTAERRETAGAQQPAPRLSTTLGGLVIQTVRGLQQRPQGGRNGVYLVSWTDPISLGGQGFGLLNELERRGFRVGTTANWSVGVTPHRVLEPAKVTAVVHLSVGADILS